LDAKPYKKSTTLPSKKQIIHYYGGGAKCDATGQPRHVEVKFRCLDNPSPSATAIALYLLEPKTCEYTLTVESSLLCTLLQVSDDYNIFDTSEYLKEQSTARDSNGQEYGTGFHEVPRRPMRNPGSQLKFPQDKDPRSADNSQEKERSFSNRMKERKVTPPPNDVEIIVLDEDEDGGGM